jgi:predicted DNA-binding antitoxin AbrB/MazE fold protein
MTAHFTAVFEGGVLRPTAPVPLNEGEQVEVIVIQPPTAAEQRSPAQILSEIAALPIEPGGQVFSGRDHDRILYGGDRGAR